MLAWAGVGVAGVLMLFQGRRPRAWFLAPMAASLVAVAVYISTVMRPGFSRYAVFFENLQASHVALIAAGALALVGLLAVSRSTAVARVVSRWTPWLVSAVVVAAVVYAYVFRAPGGRLAAHDALSLRTFTWYFPWAALVAAVAGFVLLAWKRFWRDPAWLVVTAVYGFFVFYKIQIVPEHFWMTRRFAPVILPSAFLLMAAAAFYGTWGRRREAAASRVSRLAEWALPLAFVAVVGTLLLRASGPVRAHVEYQGLLSRIDNLSHQFGPRDLVVVESRRSSDLHVVALPLAYTFQRNVLVLSTPRPDRLRFRGFLDWARSRYDNVYFMGSGGTDLLSRAVAVQALSTERFQVPEYESAWNAYPTGPRKKEFDFSIYRFVDPPDQAAPIDLRVGTSDDLFVVRFNAKEVINGQSYRWTTDSSYVTLLGITREIAQGRALDGPGRAAGLAGAGRGAVLPGQPAGRRSDRAGQGLPAVRVHDPHGRGRRRRDARRSGAAPHRDARVVAGDGHRSGRRPDAGRDARSRHRRIVKMALQLSDWRERWAVRLADAGLAAAAPLFARRRAAAAVGDRPAILLLRIERVGDLLMTLDAIAAVRTLRPHASIDLVVGAWNEPLARMIAGIDRIETLSAPWLARGAASEPARHARGPRLGMAVAPLRSRDQLRGRHPQQRVDRTVGGRAPGRLRDGRRRTDADRRGAVRSHDSHPVEFAAARRARLRSAGRIARGPSAWPGSQAADRAGSRARARGGPALVRPSGRAHRRRPWRGRPRDQAMEPRSVRGRGGPAREDPWRHDRAVGRR